MAQLNATHRKASPRDARRLLELRRESIIALAPDSMAASDAETWALNLTLEGMRKKLRELEIWVTEIEGEIAGWGAIRESRLEGLYTDPAFACRGIGTGLLTVLEGLMRARGILEISTAASANAESFYLRRGYKADGAHIPSKGTPMSKRLSN